MDSYGPPQSLGQKIILSQDLIGPAAFAYLRPSTFTALQMPCFISKVYAFFLSLLHLSLLIKMVI